MTIIGIDLGTTNSLVSYFSDEGPIIIENSQSERLTPSVISVDDNGEIFVGKIAKERLITHPDKTASIFKRSMGSKKEYKLGDKIFLPEELSSIIIKKLKEDAEKFLGEKIEEAIISVPAYFNDAQRRSTKSAGELAGLKVERIINEPTAAAIAYGFHEKKDYTKFLIFDLGGGTFDVSILELYKNIMEVRAVAGDNFIGGEDFTNVLVNYFISKIDKTIDDFTQKEIGIIKKSAEIAKREFSTSKNATMKCVIKEESVEIDITYDTYEKQCALLLAKLKKPISRALSDASINLDEIDTIILVGGATKSPIVRNYVSKLFGRLPSSNINPDEVVALGAAVCAAMKQRNQLVKEIVLTDVCPFTLGTNISVEKQNGIYESGHFFPIIERNTIIPVSRVERLYTIYDNQKSIKVKILQGESRKSDNNVYLGEISAEVPARKKGMESIDVRYTYDVNGILEVDVTVISTGAKKIIVIEKDSGAMTKEDIEKRLEELKELKIHPREKEEYRFILSRGERIYEESVGDIRRYIASLLLEYEEILDKQDQREIRDSAQSLKKILDEIEEDLEY